MPDHAPAPAGRRIALIAHDNKKRDMLEWAGYNLDLLAGHQLFATATTGRLLQQQLGLPVTCFRSGPYGGDQQPRTRRVPRAGVPLGPAWRDRRRSPPDTAPPARLIGRAACTLTELSASGSDRGAACDMESRFTTGSEPAI